MRTIYFFIGTEAELMKMYAVIKKVRENGFICKIISSGQNDISNSPFLALSDSQIDIDFAIYKPRNKSGKEYIKWLYKTERYGIQYMKRITNKENSLFVVHGDTLSTLLGARIAKKSKIHYIHIEGGLRSYNWFVPFPEEIDRYYASKNADMIFCPKQEYVETAKKCFKGEAINTIYNTGIETLMYALHSTNEKMNWDEYAMPYYVMAIHRQENLANREFMTSVVECAEKLSKKIKCVFIYHEQTKDYLQKYDLWEGLTNCKDIKIVKRLAYVEFVKVVEKAEFIIADGAGNQQEFYYMGKPYLIMRKDFEKDSEGIGLNAVSFENDFSKVQNFYFEYKKYEQKAIIPQCLPSDIIAEKIKEKY